MVIGKSTCTGHEIEAGICCPFTPLPTGESGNSAEEGIVYCPLNHVPRSAGLVRVEELLPELEIRISRRANVSHRAYIITGHDNKILFAVPV